MDNVITSASNSTVKMLRKLMVSAKARREANQFVAEGVHLAKSYLDGGGMPGLIVYAVSAADNHEVAELVSRAESNGVQVVVLADSLFESISSVHASVGVVIVFSPSLNQDSIEPLADKAIMLEAVQDPGNMGTILRTAAAVGVRRVLLSHDSTSPWSPKTLRAGMGAQFSLEVHEDCDLVSIAKTAEVPVLATSLSADNVSLYDIDLSGLVVWVFGNEGQGVSPELAEAATKRVIIPQAQSAVESLNVAAAAAVCLYEQYRQTTRKS